MTHVDRRHAYIEWRHWVSGTLPTVLIVDSPVLFLFFQESCGRPKSFPEMPYSE